MVKFIEVTNSNNLKLAVNVNHITHFFKAGNGCNIQLTPNANDNGRLYDCYILSTESYDEVKALING